MCQTYYNKAKNGFYIDCSQAKTRIHFVRLLARTLGVDDNGKHYEVKANIKYALSVLEKPLIVLDEGGDLEYSTLMIIKELWNASEGNVGWYMMGADGLKAKMKKGSTIIKLVLRNCSPGSAKSLSHLPQTELMTEGVSIPNLLVMLLQQIR